MLKAGLIFFLSGCLAFAAKAQPGDIPFAEAGKCYAKCFFPDKYEYVSEQVVLRKPAEQAKAVPARLETITAYYIAKEACTRLVPEPPRFDTVTEKVRILPAGRRLPATYDTVRETIIVRPETKYYETTEAVFEPASAPVVVEDAYTVLEALPLQYERVPDRVEIKPASTRWIRKKADPECLGASPDDCFVWCLVETPAQYMDFVTLEPRGCGGEGADDCVQMTPVAAKTIPMPIGKVKTPAKVIERTVPAEVATIIRLVPKKGAAADNEPAEYTTVTKLVLNRPARVREELVPAEYKPIQRKALMAPATVVAETVPGEYAPVVKRRLLRKGGFSDWREILCDEKITGYTVRQIQEALTALGYYKGAPEPTLGARTKEAIVQFQKDRDLPADGNVDFETLKALGISY